MNTEEFETITYVEGDETIDFLMFENGEVWLPKKQVSRLFGISFETVRIHAKRIEEAKENLEPSWTPHVQVSKKSWITAADGKRYQAIVYSLETVLEIGHRIGSNKGQKLAEWIEKY